MVRRVFSTHCTCLQLSPNHHWNWTAAETVKRIQTVSLQILENCSDALLVLSIFAAASRLFLTQRQASDGLVIRSSFLAKCLITCPVALLVGFTSPFSEWQCVRRQTGGQRSAEALPALPDCPHRHPPPPPPLLASFVRHLLYSHTHSLSFTSTMLHHWFHLLVTCSHQLTRAASSGHGKFNW